MVMTEYQTANKGFPRFPLYKPAIDLERKIKRQQNEMKVEAEAE